MRLVMVWRDYTDYARDVTSWMESYRRNTGHEIESLDPDSIEGEIFARAHDIMEYPTLVAVSRDGIVHQTWRGATNLPSFSEASYYS